MIPGWTEDLPTSDMRVWRSSEGDVLSFATPKQLDLPPLDDAFSFRLGAGK
jgi:hypothetical protein